MNKQKRIGLIDVDGKLSFPNLALMKLSAWHKQQGDLVEWYEAIGERYDIVYMAKVFSFTQDFLECVNADKVIRGGSGYNIHLQDGKEIWSESEKYVQHLPYEIEHIYPDYSIYPKDLTGNTAYGYLTRGCPRGCSFCHVAAKEGKKSVMNTQLAEFWNGQKNIVLLDPNILACKDWHLLLAQLRDSNATVDFTQGLDARLLTREKCELLSKIKMRNVHFAWDRYDDGKVILPKLKMFAEYKYKGRNPDHNAIVFVLTNYDTTIEQDLERVYKLRELGYWAYIMIYDKQHASRTHKHMARWCNNRLIFACTPRFEDYDPKRR